MMPPINYGHSGANQLGDRPIHPGTYAIRQSTLRSLVAELGGQVAKNGFKWIFVVNGHGAPTHNIAINEACDFVSETFHVTMLHVTGLFRGDAAIQSNGQQIDAKYFSAAELSSFGMDVHAGVGETSGMLTVRPDLVRSNYKTRAVFTVRREHRDVARRGGSRLTVNHELDASPLDERHLFVRMRVHRGDHAQGGHDVQLPGSLNVTPAMMRPARTFLPMSTFSSRFEAAAPAVKWSPGSRCTSANGMNWSGCFAETGAAISARSQPFASRALTVTLASRGT
jgi:hypothetical protein